MISDALGRVERRVFLSLTLGVVAYLLAGAKKGLKSKIEFKKRANSAMSVLKAS